jgi:hypothetical protein
MLLLLMSMALAVSLLPGAALAADPREETSLDLAAPEDVPLGNMARLLAILHDSHGRPITDARIAFASPASFAGTVAEMELGEARTNAEGVAALDYQLRVEGRNQFIARFHGDDEYQPVESSATTVATGTAQLSRRTAGVEVPVLGPWAIVLVLMSVWSVYLIAMLLVSQIPNAGERQA